MEKEIKKLLTQVPKDTKYSRVRHLLTLACNELQNIEKKFKKPIQESNQWRFQGGAIEHPNPINTQVNILSEFDKMLKFEQSKLKKIQEKKNASEEDLNLLD